jgi:hypothetical protein
MSPRTAWIHFFLFDPRWHPLAASPPQPKKSAYFGSQGGRSETQCLGGPQKLFNPSRYVALPLCFADFIHKTHETSRTSPFLLSRTLWRNDLDEKRSSDSPIYDFDSQIPYRETQLTPSIETAAPAPLCHPCIAAEKALESLPYLPAAAFSPRPARARTLFAPPLPNRSATQRKHVILRTSLSRRIVATLRARFPR